MKQKILLTEPDFLSSKVREVLEQFGSVETGPFSREGLIKYIENIDVLFIRLGHKVDKEIIDAAEDLKIIATSTTGLDHIDVDYATRKNVRVLSLKGETEFLKNVTATAELAWGLLLDLSRKIGFAVQHTRRGHWERDVFMGQELSGKTIAIIGCGRLGRMVKKYAESFSMKILVCDPYIEDQETLSLQECLKGADIISVHVPLNKETHHMFNQDVFEFVKPGALFINTARGAVVDSGALLKALESGQLAGAALDVVEGEIQGYGTMKKNSLIQYARAHENLIITPHIGGLTCQSLEKAELFMARKIRDCIQYENL